ncbi:MAG: phosphoglycerate dehydrogenase [Oligoflexia bacterium]|nr:phosphoglycerate dehydrogenase [Oligoflexia bacterium]
MRPEPLPKPLKVLLLEGIHPLARELFSDEGCAVEQAGTLLPDQLRARLTDTTVLGVRSKTRLPAELLSEAKDLLAVGCFCIGTDHVDLAAARRLGIPVFNAPLGNTRSVAELIVAELVLLSRQLGQRNGELHRGVWHRTAAGAREVRGKTLGIVGYGNIGSQVSVLAEAMGMRVVFFDILPKAPLGGARSRASLGEVLRESDFVTLHVPETALTRGMIGGPQLAEMKKGAHLLNASRGSVVEVSALADALKSGKLAGAALDVFPDEPDRDSEDFRSELQGLDNVILTPHIGGATQEAYSAIAQEVPTALIRFLKGGATTGAVNFPPIELPPSPGSHRIVNIHRNHPSALSEIHRALHGLGARILAQALVTEDEIGYLLLDTAPETSSAVRTVIAALEASIRTRLLA